MIIDLLTTENIIAMCQYDKMQLEKPTVHVTVACI